MVICLHDAGDNGASFAGLLDELSAGHSPLAYDRPGHGRSGSLDSLGSVAAMVAHLRGLAGALQLERPVLVGEGLGAAIALEAAITDPGWPAALVLVGGAAADFATEQLAATVEQLRSVTQGKARRAFDNTGYAPDTPRETYQRAFAEWVRTDPRATLGDRLAQQAWSGRGRLSGVTCPVAIVVGEHEDDAARQSAQALAAELPSATVTTLAGAGRHGVIENPSGLADAVTTATTEVVR